MKILVVAHYTSGVAKEGGSSRFMRTLIDALIGMGHDVTATNEPTKCSGQFDLIVYSHVVSDMTGVPGKKIQIAQGIIADEDFAPGADVYVSISEEIRQHNILQKGIDSIVIGQPINIGERQTPGRELRNILIIRNKPITDDPFVFLSEKYDVKISDIEKPIEDQIAWADLCITLGRGALESMAQGKPVLVADNRDYIGAYGDGYVTKDNIEEIAKNNFSGRRFKIPITREWIESELAKYSPDDSGFLHDYVKNNHEAEMVVREYLGLVTPKKSSFFKNSGTSLAIGVPCSFPQVPVSFFYSFVLMDKPSFTFIYADNGPIDTLRNDIVERALAAKVKNLLMMDVDQVYDPNTATKLLSHKLPIVGAKVHRRYPPFDPIMLKLTPDGYVPMNYGDYEPGSLVECDATGTGCIMYDMEVFRKLPKPWFRFRKNPQNGMIIGEDVGLCQDLKEIGYKIYVDTSIEIGHLSTMVVNEETHKLYCAMTIAREKKNAAMGIGARE